MPRVRGLFAIIATPLLFLGCEPPVEPPPQTSHQKFSWKASDFFDEPSVVALCEALQSNDLKETKRLIKEGVDVNARGKGNMTPLLWAFPDNQPERLRLLLENGADPNVIFTSNFGVKGHTFVGNSVTHMAAESHFPDYFDIVFSNGGDPNLVSDVRGRTRTSPIFRLLEGPGGDKLRKVRMLMELGIEIDRADGDGYTAVMVAARRGHFDIAIELLNKGADPRLKNQDTGRSLIHTVLFKERRLDHLSPAQQAQYHDLLALLEKKGLSIEEARSDIEHWESR